MAGTQILEIAVAAPLMGLFDYLPPVGWSAPGAAPQPANLQPGIRIRVPFGSTTRIGLLMNVKTESDLPGSRLRHAQAIIDSEPVVPEDILRLLAWASAYYQHPPGEVVAAALPKALRSGKARLGGASARRRGAGPHAAPATGSAETAGPADGNLSMTPVLNAGQQEAVAAINAAGAFQSFLLDGVTGSGKTEVYLQCIGQRLAAGRQSLVLVPEIGLTPQLVERFSQRFPGEAAAGRIVVLHSGLADGDRLRAFSAAGDGTADIVIGTRSAVFTPLRHPGLIVVDEEHDASYKQQDGFRYSARDLAVWRARAMDVPVVLGSATPALESVENARAGRYRHLVLPDRAGAAVPPTVRMVDMRTQAATAGMSRPLLDAMRAHLESDGQVLIFLNRRGYAPTLVCIGCGYVVNCGRCDARMVLHQRRGRITCHHCGSDQARPSCCPSCHGELRPVGQGTERVEELLAEEFPDYPLERIDRDTTRRRGEIERRLARVRSAEARVLLGTQMLTKGHDFPGVTLVGILDADQGLFGTDFRSAERLAQTFIQVAGRAGRADRPGEVWLQTLFPEHPLLRVLISQGYGAFAGLALEERRNAGWPPWSALALLRAEAPRREVVFAFLEAAAGAARSMATDPSGPPIHVLGPAPAPMERRSGRYRGQLLLKADVRRDLHRCLPGFRVAISGLRAQRQVRWSLDVDPSELF